MSLCLERLPQGWLLLIYHQSEGLGWPPPVHPPPPSLGPHLLPFLLSPNPVLQIHLFVNSALPLLEPPPPCPPQAQSRDAAWFVGIVPHHEGHGRGSVI